MAIYIVDTENDIDYGFVKNLDPSVDEVVFFYSNKTRKISFELMHYLTNNGIMYNFEFCDVGYPNALDFHIVVFVTNLISKNKFNELTFVIVSNDKGFEVAFNYLKSLEPSNCEIKYLRRNSDILTLLNEHLEHLKLETRFYGSPSELHNSLVKELGKEKGQMLYKEFKEGYSI